MNINDLTLGQAKELAATFGGSSVAQTGAWEIGKNYLIRTVTHIQTGRVIAVDQHEICIEDAAWIADTGRFSGALESADFSEVEPFPQGRVLVGRGALIDAVQINSLPRSQK
tara:strand:- start:26 stop:361 length:336 start_codon:yes stop_codon:yes gene_type:complete